MNRKILVILRYTKTGLVSVLSALFFLSLSCQQQAKTNSNYEIATWKDFKQAAVCFTFDDGSKNHYDVAIPMFDAYDFKLTMFVPTRWSPRWDILKKAAANGHEIASHTVSHAKLSSLTDARQEAELADSQNEINLNIGSKECLTLAYPDCVTGLYEIVSKYYIAARGCQGFIEQSTPADFLNISSIICGRSGAVRSETDFIKMTEDALSANGFCVFLIHAIDDDVGYSPLSSEILKQELAYLLKNRDRVWVATFVDIVKYIKERDDVSISETAAEKNRIIFKVTDNLDNGIYNSPLNIRRRLPINCLDASVSQNGKQIQSTIVTLNSVRYVAFELIPDSGDVYINLK
jgi:hypothetical protein